MPKIKICGITNLEDARFAALCGVDYLGFIFAKSPRKISPAKSAKIIKTLPKSIKKVGVFVNSPANYINRVAKKIGLDLVQLHGDESPEFCGKIKLPIIKLRCRSGGSRPATTAAKNVYAILFDAYVPGKRGGTGRLSDWVAAKKAVKDGYRVFLSGGLNPKNLAKAIKTVKPFAIDLNSGVEIRPGKKDLSLVKRAIEIVKSLC